jgi:hypothetical protein
MRQNIATFGEEGAKFFNESRYEKLAKLEAERRRRNGRSSCFFFFFPLSPRLIGTVGATLVGFGHTAFFANLTFVPTVEVKTATLTVVFSFGEPATAVRAVPVFVVFFGS